VPGDPVPRHLAAARELLASRPDLAGRVAFAEATADRLPVSAGSVDLLWYRGALVDVPALEPVYAEFRRVLAGRGGLAVVYQTFATNLLERHDRDAAPGRRQRRAVDIVDDYLETGRRGDLQAASGSTRTAFRGSSHLATPPSSAESRIRTPATARADSSWSSRLSRAVSSQRYCCLIRGG